MNRRNRDAKNLCDMRQRQAAISQAQDDGDIAFRQLAMGHATPACQFSVPARVRHILLWCRGMNMQGITAGTHMAVMGGKQVPWHSAIICDLPGHAMCAD